MSQMKTMKVQFLFVGLFVLDTKDGRAGSRNYRCFHGFHGFDLGLRVSRKSWFNGRRSEKLV